MGRWEPDARGRLERAALDLFVKQGFADTTVPQIAQHAGLTTRTFFRYFADKREVLFSGEEDLRDQFRTIIRSAPEGLTPMQLIEFGLDAVAAQVFEARFDVLQRWRSVVATDDGLRERALRKEELTVRTAIEAFEERGIDTETAELVAKLSMVVLQSALEHWLAESTPTARLVDLVHSSLDRLRATVGSADSTPRVTPVRP